MAVAHKRVVLIYPLLLAGTVYEEERYDRLLPRQEEQDRTRAIKALERLGYAVTLANVAESVGVANRVVLRGLLRPSPSGKRPA